MLRPRQKLRPHQCKGLKKVCGWILARAHAKSGDAATISGYAGKSEIFDEAIGEFALTYADQTENDHSVLAAAEHAGRIDALMKDE